jgi:hypothetical protein
MHEDGSGILWGGYGEDGVLGVVPSAVIVVKQRGCLKIDVCFLL